MSVQVRTFGANDSNHTLKCVHTRYARFTVRQCQPDMQAVLQVWTCSGYWSLPVADFDPVVDWHEDILQKKAQTGVVHGLLLGCRVIVIDAFA